MTTIHPETQIVASHYDAPTRICSYTYQHTDGSRYTVKVPIDALERNGNAAATRQQRRQIIAQKIINHVQRNPPDHVLRQAQPDPLRLPPPPSRPVIGATTSPSGHVVLRPHR